MDEVLIDANTEAASSTASDDKGTESSTVAATETVEQTLADVVKETAAKSVESEKQVEETVEENVPEKVETVKEDISEASKSDEDPDAKLPFHKHPRFQEVIKERQTFKTELEQAKPYVEYAKAVSKFCQENQVSNEDVSVAFRLVALAKKDVGAFKQELRAILDNVEITTGDKLPSDLQKKLDDGVIDEETAKELSLMRETAKGSKTAQERAGRTAQEQLQQAITTSLTVWEQSKQKSDVDYIKRLPLIRDRYVALAMQRTPQTSGEAVALAEQAYNEVVGELKNFSPQKPVRKVLTTAPAKRVNGDGDLKLDSLDDLGKLVRTVANRHRV